MGDVCDHSGPVSDRAACSRNTMSEGNCLLPVLSIVYEHPRRNTAECEFVDRALERRLTTERSGDTYPRPPVTLTRGVEKSDRHLSMFISYLIIFFCFFSPMPSPTKPSLLHQQIHAPCWFAQGRSWLCPYPPRKPRSGCSVGTIHPIHCFSSTSVSSETLL